MERHSLTAVNEATRTGTCAVCGPGAKVWKRDGGRYRCAAGSHETPGHMERRTRRVTFEKRQARAVAFTLIAHLLDRITVTDLKRLGLGGKDLRLVADELARHGEQAEKRARISRDRLNGSIPAPREMSHQ